MYGQPSGYMPAGIITGFDLQEVSRNYYNDVYRRDYVFNVKHQDIESIENMLVSNKRHNISNAMLASYTPNIVGLNDLSSGLASIPHGWGESRLKFTLAVEYNNNVTGTVIYHIKGYSEYIDQSLNGLIDDNLRFFINNVVVYRKVVTDQGTTHLNVFKAYNLLYDMHGNYTVEDESYLYNNDVGLIRPSDIINELTFKTTAVTDGIASYSGNVGMLGTSPNTSTTTNNSTLSYAGKLINGLVDSVNNSYNDNTGLTDILRNTSSDGRIAETPLIHELFFMDLKNITGNYNMNVFTPNDLYKWGMDPKFRPNVVRNTIYQSGNGLLTTQHTMNTNAANPITSMVMATINAITDIIVRNKIVDIDVVITNDIANSGNDISILSGTPAIVGVQAMNVFPYIVSAIRTEVMPVLTKNNNIRVSGIFHIELSGTNACELSIDGAPAVVYRFPSFASSLYSPMLTSTNNKTAVANSVETLFEMILDNNSLDTSMLAPTY